MNRAKPGYLALLIGGAVLAASLLGGCASSPPGGVQVVDRNQGAYIREPLRRGRYLVRPGDTLYSIAFRFGWDWKTLATHNGIGAPYLLRPGDYVRFDGPLKSEASRRTVSAASRPKTPIPSSAKATPPATSPPAAKPSAAAVARPRAPQAPVRIPATRSAAAWTWPSLGTMVGRFAPNGSLNKGIDIAGELGQPVFAASDGLVVYAGSGLRGYGELLIIKHDDVYVSAYGHNRRLLVREGQQVKAGQTIAEMGSTGTDRVKLHFEIRRQGKPVDPLQYLPRR
ncbi:MAG TPA: peptidoglycan DD-metalloendopeptidase family protein [Pseudomonas sp.]|nr:peptidoglycan DD-metalloendopeptidase family protein [Pseudomonas sp.]